jgi:TRAP-type C4-dicarboxylate transport system permease small subunit
MILPMRPSKVDWLDKGVRYLENALAVTLLSAIIVDVLLEVYFRYVLSHPLSWSGEIATYMFAWLTVIGIAIAQRDHSHIEVRFFSHLSDAAGVATAWISWTTSLLFFIMLAIGGYLFSSGSVIEEGPATGLPLWVAYACLPVGAILGIYHTLMDLPELIRSPLALGAAHHPEEDISA